MESRRVFSKESSKDRLSNSCTISYILGATIQIDALRAHCAETLASYKVPEHWEVRAQPLPRNASGKVLKAVLSGDLENEFIEE